jgi:thiamine-phosphate pyrophosphorylase
VAVGSIFPTHTKAEFTLVGLELLKQVRERCSVPLVAIGGITGENIGEVIKVGADGAAVISAIGAAPDPERATRQLVQAVHDAKATASQSQ